MRGWRVEVWVDARVEMWVEVWMEVWVEVWMDAREEVGGSVGRAHEQEVEQRFGWRSPVAEGAVRFTR